MTGEARQTDRRVIRPHALRRMTERRIPEEAVDWVLANYHTHRPAPVYGDAKPCEIYVGEWGGRALKVYVLIGSDPPVVTTVVYQG